MASTADAMALDPVPDPAQVTSGRDQTFKRVYQACESCRQKKQKCSLGDPAYPKRPCNACRRANLLCGRFVTCYRRLRPLTTPQSSPQKSEKAGLQRNLGTMLGTRNYMRGPLPRAMMTSNCPTQPTKTSSPLGRRSWGLLDLSWEIMKMLQRGRLGRARVIVTHSYQVTTNKSPVKLWRRSP